MIKTIINSVLIFILVSAQSQNEKNQLLLLDRLKDLFEDEQFLSNLSNSNSRNDSVYYVGYSDFFHPDKDYLVNSSSGKLNVWARKIIFFNDIDNWIFLNNIHVDPCFTTFTLEFVSQHFVYMKCNILYNLVGNQWNLEKLKCDNIVPPIEFVRPSDREN